MLRQLLNQLTSEQDLLFLGSKSAEGIVRSHSIACCNLQVDLTARLREILVNYPEGTSILKELVQVLLPRGVNMA